MICKKTTPILFIIVLVCTSLSNCRTANKRQELFSRKHDSIVYFYNNYLDNPQEPYIGGWSKPTVELGVIGQSYFDYKGDNALRHYIFTELGDTIPSTLFQRLKMDVRGYDSIFKSTIQSNKYKNKDLDGVNLVKENDRITYYILWPTDSTRTFYGRAKLVEWEYYFVERPEPMRIVDGVIIST